MFWYANRNDRVGSGPHLKWAKKNDKDQHSKVNSLVGLLFNEPAESSTCSLSSPPCSSRRLDNGYQTRPHLHARLKTSSGQSNSPLSANQPSTAVHRPKELKWLSYLCRATTSVQPNAREHRLCRMSWAERSQSRSIVSTHPLNV